MRQGTWGRSAGLSVLARTIHGAGLFLLLIISCRQSPAFELVDSTTIPIAMRQTPELDRVYIGQEGPWGQLEYTRIAIEPPDEFLHYDTGTTATQPTWIFPGHTRSQVEAKLRESKLTLEQLEQLLRATQWSERPEGVALFPSPELVLQLSAESRASIYNTLSQFKENEIQCEPFTFREEFLEERFERSGLSQEVIDGFKRLLYRQGSVLLFADAGIYMATLPTADERLRFFRAMSRRLTLLVKLKVSPNSNVKQIAQYWDFAGRHKELKPLLESLTRVPEECKLDIAHLLPPFARKRIYTFPDPNDPLGEKRDCHWTAFNFFNDPVNDNFCNPAFTGQVAQTEYDRVSGPWKFGDLVVLANPFGDTIHSAVFLADDVVFTKNGGANSQPFTYMHLRDMLEGYATSDSADRPMKVLVFRKKQI